MKKYVFEVSALSDEELAEISGKGINDISEKYGYTLFDVNTDPMRILTAGRTSYLQSHESLYRYQGLKGGGRTG